MTRGTDLWELALGFMDAQAVLTAEALGVFQALDPEPRSAAEVARAAGLPEDGALRLLTFLCSLGVVERRQPDRFANAAEAAEKLVPGKPGYVGGMFRHLREELYLAWSRLGEALRAARGDREGAPDRELPTENLFSDPEALRAFMEGMHAITRPAARELAEHADELEGLRSLVDVGGASGALVLEMARRHPGLEATVFDLPPVRRLAEERFRSSELGDRLRFQPGDFWKDPLPAGADAYALGFVLHDWDRTGGSLLLGKIAEAARPGSWLIVGEYLLDDDRTGPRFVARQDLNMLLAARGRERTAAEYREWLGEHGFTVERILPTSRGKNYMLARYEGAAAGPGSG
ncbi:MAG: methyltransferase [Thermoanaerobaculia bacterium]